MNEVKYNLEACQECYRICLAMVNHCQAQGGALAEPKQIRLLLDCAEICQTAAEFLPRGSELHHTICNACAVVCLKCAAACEEFIDDKLMQACAVACRRAAAVCQALFAGASEQQLLYQYEVSLATSRATVN
jgi:hypothetical protein